MKKAFLVTFEITTRVVVDVEGDLTSNKNFDKINQAGIDKILENNIEDYITHDNGDYRLDEENPYPQSYDI